MEPRWLAALKIVQQYAKCARMLCICFWWLSRVLSLTYQIVVLIVHIYKILALCIAPFCKNRLMQSLEYDLNDCNDKFVHHGILGSWWNKDIVYSLTYTEVSLDNLEFESLFGAVFYC
jgi:hypothetical protein